MLIGGGLGAWTLGDIDVWLRIDADGPFYPWVSDSRASSARWLRRVG